jgi:ABC-type amino acid transport substrate-binding protein/two-component sensor histidine kinase
VIFIARVCILVAVLLMHSKIVIAVPLTKITLQLQWKHQFQFAGFYAAKALGYYKDAGLDVEFFEYDGNFNIVDEVLSGKKDFGVWDSQLIAERLQGKPIKIIANYFKRSPLAIIGTSDIKTPADLKGKRVEISPNDLRSANIQAMLRQFNIKNEDLIIVPYEFAIDDFISGKIDAVGVFLTNEPYTVRQSGVSFKVLDPSNYGAELYDLILFTSENYSNAHPETVKAFREASNRGWTYALENQDKIIDIIQSEYDTQNKRRGKLQFEANETAKIVLPKVYPVGSVDSERIRRMGELFVQLGQADSLGPLKDCIFKDAGGEIYGGTKIALSPVELAYLKENGDVTIAMVTENPPFAFDEGSGGRGFDHDLLQIISAKTGIKFKKQYGPWESIFGKFKNGSVDVIADISYKKDRESFSLFTTPYFEMPTVVYVRNDFKDYKGFQSLKGKKVGYTKGIYYESSLREQEGIDLVGFESSEEMVNALVYGKVDAVINNLARINHIIMKNGYVNVQVADELNLPGMGKEDLRLGVTTNKPLLQSILQKAIDGITRDERQALITHWLGVSAVLSGLKAPKIELTEAEKEWLRKNPVLRVSNESNYPPYDFSAGDQPQGFSVELLNLLAERLGIKIKYITLRDWSQLMAMYSRGEIDMLHSLAQTPERSKEGLFSDPYFRTRTVFAMRAEKQAVTKLKQLKGKTIAVCKGGWPQEYLRKHNPEINLFVGEDIDEILNAVLTGKADALIEEQGSIQYRIRTDRLLDLKIGGLVEEMMREKDNGFRFYVKRSAPELITILNKALASLTPDEFDALQIKCFGASDRQNANDFIKRVDLTADEKEYLQSRKEFKVCMFRDWMPYSRVSENGGYEGINADIVTTLQDKIGTKFVWYPTSDWSECLEAIKANNCDMTPAAVKIPSRSDEMSFTSSYAHEPIVVATNSKEIFVKDGTEIGSRSVGVVKGSAIKEMLLARYPDMNIVTVDSSKDGLERVRNGEIWGYVDSMPTIGYSLQKFSMLDLKIAGRLEFDADLSVASRKDSPLLASVVQKAIETITSEEKQSIASRWISVKYEQGFDYALLWKLAGVSAVLVSGIFFWNRKLSKLNSVIRYSQQQTKNLLDNSGQGFLSCDDDLLVKEHYSAECKTIFNVHELAGVSLPELLSAAANAPNIQFLTRNFTAILRERDDFRRDVYISLLPKNYTFKDRHYAVEYKVLEDSGVCTKQYDNKNRGLLKHELMLVLTDITSQRLLESVVENEQQCLRYVVSVVNNRNDVFLVVNDFQIFLDRMISGELVRSYATGEFIDEFYRETHTFKGLFCQFEFPNLPLKLHELEQHIAYIKDKPEGHDSELLLFQKMEDCRHALDQDMSILSQSLGREFFQERSVLSISQRKALDIERLAKRMLSTKQGVLHDPEIVDFFALRRIRFVSASSFLRPYACLVEQISKRLDKIVAPIVFEGDDPALDPDAYEEFFRSLVHVFRNAVVHGIETQEERIEKDKPESATISCKITVSTNDFLLEISDDGRGVDTIKLLQKAKEIGIVGLEMINVNDPKQLARLVSLDGISASATIDQLSGRGVGLASVYAAVNDIGGEMKVFSICGKGTTFQFCCPFIESLSPEGE